MRLRTVLATATAGLTAVTCLTLAVTVPASAAPAPRDAAGRPTANACSPYADLDGFSDALDETTFDGLDVGNLSGLSVDRGGRIAAVSDRSVLFDLDVHQGGGAPRATVAAGMPIADENGGQLDSEAVVVDHDGTYLITSETEPSIRRYDRAGHLVGRLPVPSYLQVAPAGRAQSNLTFEGLTLLPGGHTLVASMEESIAGDDQDLTRLQTWNRVGDSDAFTLGRQYGFRLDPGLGISEIASTGDGRLLVLERGFTAGFGNTVRLYAADLRGASDTSGITDLTASSGARLIRTTLVADIGRCPSLGATARQPQPNPLLDNIEGLTVTGRTPDGRLRLLMISDNNDNPDQVTRLYSLTVRLPRR
ncbi:esterase-like activity of phytase family protein [Streptantibioticus silvisoli]|uniref:Esterase-like activity of phytase family protein n=1 Tax=Streptantibioticus silvisoli TaxID=2705255 RepID=A0ABT6W8R5_9ACTN|nr:esterase-like activity of phytase family protein [Streptantibioticus silvisoli]MDI5967044.1 esterase-like activity of phytase family protein [Streptantibioticus silvisoli]